MGETVSVEKESQGCYSVCDTEFLEILSVKKEPKLSARDMTEETEGRLTATVVYDVAGC